MIVVDLPMPKNCLECPVRMDCRVYRIWIMDVADRDVLKPNSCMDCLIKEERKKRK